MKKEDAEFIWSLMPEWVKDNGTEADTFDPMFFGTLSREGDIKVSERVKSILFRPTESDSILKEFISKVKEEFPDQNFDYLHFIAERVKPTESEEVDAGEFAEWCSSEGWTYKNDTKLWYHESYPNMVGKYFNQSRTTEYMKHDFKVFQKGGKE